MLHRSISKRSTLCLLIRFIKLLFAHYSISNNIQFLFVSTGVCSRYCSLFTRNSLHCTPHGEPLRFCKSKKCHLLTVRSVTSARKGLTPLGRQRLADGDASGNISCITLSFNTENLYFKHFFKAFRKVCTCSCWAHTKAICNAGFSV